MTARERRAFLVASCVLLLASAGRWVYDGRGREPLLPADSLGVVDELLEGTREAIAEEERRSQPLDEGETLDPNRASAIELDRLPGVGPATADRIVAERESGGAFATVADLERVRGIGSATMERMAPHLEIGPIPAGLARVRRETTASPRLGPGSPRLTEGTPRLTEGSPRAVDGDSRPSSGPPVLDLNHATAAELESLRGIGPALARRILEYREASGRFGRVEDLLDIRGIGPATLESLRPDVKVGP